MVDKFVKRFSSLKDARVAAMLLAQQAEEIFLGDSPEDKFAEAMFILDEAKTVKSIDPAEVLDFLNDTFGSHFTHLGKIQNLIQKKPNVTMDQFKSIILHKWETWGSDEKMRPYLRPATLFGSVNKFNDYLDDATNYWMFKLKKNDQRRTA